MDDELLEISEELSELSSDMTILWAAVAASAVSNVLNIVIRRHPENVVHSVTHQCPVSSQSLER
jgi:hypothetical protein